MIRTAAAAACSLVILAGAVGCGSAAEQAGPADAATQPAGAPQPSVSIPPVPTDPAQPLPMPAQQKILYRTEGRRGSAHLAVISRIPRGTLGIVALCNGPGRILVHLRGIATFGAGCGTGPGVYNEIALGSAKKSVAVSVTGSTGNEWALTMGWTSVIDHPTG